MPRLIGRPPVFETPEQMADAINKYFSTDALLEDAEGRSIFAPTMTGLARAIGLSRQSLCNYAEKSEFLDTIKEARSIVAEALEQKLYGSAVTGVIFNLKNNFGWKDKQEIDQKNIEISHEEWLKSLK